MGYSSNSGIFIGSCSGLLHYHCSTCPVPPPRVGDWLAADRVGSRAARADLFQRADHGCAGSAPVRVDVDHGEARPRDLLLPFLLSAHLRLDLDHVTLARHLSVEKQRQTWFSAMRNEDVDVTDGSERDLLM